MKQILDKLSKSKFRSSFHLKLKEKEYVNKKGYDVIYLHAKEFIENRLSPNNLKNDGKQTPYHGHPVFVAQHATATCCRGCLEKWYQIPKNRKLTEKEINYIVSIIMEWIKREMNS